MATLYGTVIGEKIVPFDSQDTYPTHEDFYGQGGYVVVDSSYATNVTIDQVLGSNSLITSGRRKVGQILYLPLSNKHYTFTTNTNLVSNYDIKPALPHEYIGSVVSTNFVAKTSSFSDRNFIDSYYRLNIGYYVWEREPFEHCAILAGSNNRIVKDSNLSYFGTNVNSTIVGGSGNNIFASNYSTILGGDRNFLQQNHSVILGGTQNRSGGPWNVLGGGLLNNLGGTAANARFSSLIGGQENTLLGSHNFLGGGLRNKISGNYNAIAGGDSNEALGISDIVVGGRLNKTLGGAESGKLLFARQYNELTIDPNYILDTQIFTTGPYNWYTNRQSGLLVESIPGASVNGLNAAGVLRMYINNNTVQGSMSGRTLTRSISSPSPTTLGRFGHSVYNIFSPRSAGDRFGVVVGEPGTNKVYIYSLSANSNPFGQPALLQTLNLSDVDPSAPSNSQYGFSVAFNRSGWDDYVNGVPVGGPFNLLFVGAPGNSTVYVYKSDRIDPVTDGANPFTYITKLTGAPNSEFGYSLLTNSAWRGYNLPSISAAFIAVGAPNANTPQGTTGDVYLYFSQTNNTTHSRLNKTFTPFSSAQSILSYLYNDLKPGDRAGESFGEWLTVGFRYDNPTIQEQALTNVTDLTSWNILSYINVPKKNLNIVYKPNPTINNKIDEQFFTFSLDFNGSQMGPGWVNKVILSGGAAFGQNTYFTSTSSSVNGGYGNFSLFGQGYFSNTDWYGPNKLRTGVYSVDSILNGTNFQWYRLGLKTGTDSYNNFRQIALSKNPRNFNSTIGTNHPGSLVYYSYVAEANGTQIIAPYPPSANYGNIQNYGFINFDVPSTELDPGILCVYYVSGGKLSYAVFANDLPGETPTTNVIVGGNSNTVGARSSTILGGTSNNIGIGNTVGLIVAGNTNSLTDTTGDGISKFYNSVIQGNNNKVDGSQYSTILNGNNNTINRYANNSAILGGSGNTINNNISACYVLGLSLTGNKSNTVFIENLKAVGHIEAKTKSFTIKHPTKEGKTLTYGSLESPYHGVRLTGFGKLNKGICVVELPEYTNKLVKEQNINIQLTNYRHDKVLYVDNIDLSKNTFTVKTNSVLSKIFNYEFFWTFTAIRTDVPEIQVES